MNKLQGRDQLVWPITKFCHAPLTARGFIYCRNGGVRFDNSCERRTPSGPLSQTCQGSVKVRLDWPTTSSGSKSESASTSKDFGTPAVYFALLGSRPTNSTRRWSRKGTRTSREFAMLAASVSRSSVFTIYDCNSKQEAEVNESSRPACRTVSRIRARHG